MYDPVLSRLSIARKAGFLAFGFQKSKEAVQKGKSFLVVIADGISQKTEKEMRFFASDKVPVIKIKANIDELSKAIGVKAGIVSVSDRGLSEAIISKSEADGDTE